MELTWQWSSRSIRDLSRAERHWLTYSGSMTKKMQSACGSLKIELLKQVFEVPRLEESQLLGLPPYLVASIREVVMICDGEPWLYARTIIPKKVLHGPARRFQQLGTTPIGRLLFQELHLKRSRFQYAKVTELSHFHGWNANLVTAGVIARRSQFLGLSHPILLYEFFLPKMLQGIRYG